MGIDELVAPRNLDQLIHDHPFFKDMDPQASRICAGCAVNQRFDAGQYIFREGEDADNFYLIRRGRVALEIRVPGKAPLIVSTLQAGDVLGWSWLVPPYRWIADARAVELCRVISLDGRCLRGKLEDNHTLGYELFKRFIPVLADRIHAGRLQLMDIYGKPRQRD